MDELVFFLEKILEDPSRYAEIRDAAIADEKNSLDLQIIPGLTCAYFLGKMVEMAWLKGQMI